MAPASRSRSSPRHVAGWINPRASWEAFLVQLSAADVQQYPPTPSGPSQKKPRGSADALHTPNACQELEEDPSPRRRSPCVRDICREETSWPESPDFILTGLHACGDLSATLLRHFVHCPHVCGITSVACCYMKISTKENPSPPGRVECPVPLTPNQEPLPSEFGYPMSSWVQRLPGHRLSYKAREGACHAVEDYVRRLRDESELLRTHCYRAMLEVFIRETRPDLCRAGIQTIKKAHLLPFTE